MDSEVLGISATVARVLGTAPAGCTSVLAELSERVLSFVYGSLQHLRHGAPACGQAPARTFLGTSWRSANVEPGRPKLIVQSPAGPGERRGHGSGGGRAGATRTAPGRPRADRARPDRAAGARPTHSGTGVEPRFLTAAWPAADTTAHEGHKTAQHDDRLRGGRRRTSWACGQRRAHPARGRASGSGAGPGWPELARPTLGFPAAEQPGVDEPHAWRAAPDTYLTASQVVERLDILAAACPVREACGCSAGGRRRRVEPACKRRGPSAPAPSWSPAAARTSHGYRGWPERSRAGSTSCMQRTTVARPATRRAVLCWQRPVRCQIAEDLLAGGRQVILATSPVGRAPARHRGRDTVEWLVECGFFQQRPQDLPDPSVMAAPSTVLAPGGRSMSLQALGVPASLSSAAWSQSHGERSPSKQCPDQHRRRGCLRRPDPGDARPRHPGVPVSIRRRWRPTTPTARSSSTHRRP